MSIWQTIHERFLKLFSLYLSALLWTCTISFEFDKFFLYCSRLFYSNHVNQLVFRFLENYLQQFNKLTNKDRDENNKEKTTCDIKVTEDLGENKGEIVIDEINTIAEEIVSMDGHSHMDDQNSNNSVKKGKKESQKKQVERRKKQGMIIELYMYIDFKCRLLKLW